MKKGQVWIETVIYTLIGLTFIGIILAVALPRINTYRDRIVVEQSVESMNIFDSKIREVMDSSPGNVRKIDFFSIKKGKITFIAEEDKIVFTVDELAKPYSEPGAVIKAGAVEIVTEQLGKTSRVELTLNYNETADLEFENSEELKEFAESSTPYTFTIENKGVNYTKIIVDIREISGK